MARLMSIGLNISDTFCNEGSLIIFFEIVTERQGKK